MLLGQNFASKLSFKRARERQKFHKNWFSVAVFRRLRTPTTSLDIWRMFARCQIENAEKRWQSYKCSSCRSPSHGKCSHASTRPSPTSAFSLRLQNVVVRLRHRFLHCGIAGSVLWNKNSGCFSRPETCTGFVWNQLSGRVSAEPSPKTLKTTAAAITLSTKFVANRFALQWSSFFYAATSRFVKICGARRCWPAWAENMT